MRKKQKKTKKISFKKSNKIRIGKNSKKLETIFYEIKARVVCVYVGSEKKQCNKHLMKMIV